MKIDNQTEIIPIVYKFSSKYNDSYKPEKVLEEDGYYCTKTNKDEFITFKFDKEYCFTKIVINFPDKYEKARLKKFKINIFDINEKLINTYNFTNNNSENIKVHGDMDDKGAYLNFELIENFKEDYFCIKRIQFFVDIIHSLK